MGLTNKSIIILLSLSIALLMFSITVTLTGYDGLQALTGKATGEINVTVGSTLEINFTTNALAFGTGSVSLGNATCILGTNRTDQPGCTGWTSKGVGLVIENSGNSYARINITNTNYSSSFFAGANSSVAGYAIRITTPKANGTTCQGMGPTGSIVLEANNTWYNLTAPLNSSNMLCSSLNFSDTDDTVQIDFQFSIPGETNIGSQSDSWVATAVAA